MDQSRSRFILTTGRAKEERKKSKVRKKVRKGENKKCYMHLLSVKNEDVLDFTRARWDTYRNCMKQWLCHPGANKDLAEIYKHCLDIEFETIPDDAGFHTTCYRRFTDKQRLLKAESKRARAGGEPAAATEPAAPESTSEVAAASETPRKKLRSRSGLPISSAGPVLQSSASFVKKLLSMLVWIRKANGRGINS